MKTKNILYVAFILIISATACKNKIDIPFYEISNHDLDRQLNRIVFNVVIEKPQEDNIIEAISEAVKESQIPASSTIIFYRLKGNENNAAWARVDYSPKYQMTLIGPSKTDSEKLSKPSTEGIDSADIIGKWRDYTSFAERTLILYKKENNLYVRWTYPDQSFDDTPIKKIANKYKVIDIGGYDEWYVIEKNGNLGTYSTKGKFSESNPI